MKTKLVYILLAVALVVSGYQLLMSRVSIEESNIVSYRLKDMGREHMPHCTEKYNTKPATSGCHSPTIADYAIFVEPQDESVLVHNLEHGAVIVHYRIPLEAGEENLVPDLVRIVTDLKQDPKYCRVILAPYPAPFAVPESHELADIAHEKRIALTSWTQIALLDAADEKMISDFTKKNINQSPERIADNCR